MRQDPNWYVNREENVHHASEHAEEIVCCIFVWPIASMVVKRMKEVAHRLVAQGARRFELFSSHRVA